MTLTQELFAFLTCTAVMMVFHCEADRLPPPTQPSYDWVDPFTVNVSWVKPTGLPDHCEIEYEVQLGKDNSKVRTRWEHIIRTCMTEGLGPAGCQYTIHTVGKKCDRNASTPLRIITAAHVPQAEVVKEFKCITYIDKMDCSWIPVNPSLELTLFYRVCGPPEDKNPLKKCDELYSDGQKDGCYLKGPIYKEEICIFVRTETGGRTFKPSLVLPSLNMSVREEGDELELSWTFPEVGKNCRWIYEVCYRHCSEPTVCENYTTGGEPLKVGYNKRCHYEFQSRAMTNDYCINIQSEKTETVIYGTDEPPDGTLTVVAIVIPIILSICVILSCYCFRRHRAIICPIIPDPSAIFKEMMMNGNKELKATPGNLYTPVPEPIEPCKITLVSENSVLQQNS